MAVRNSATGQLVEDERRESSGKLIIRHLVPGKYEMVVYTHKCITNLGSSGDAVQAFDILLEMRVRALRQVDGREGEAAKASVPIQITDGSSRSAGSESADPATSPHATPLLVSADELRCMQEYLHLPEELNANGVSSQIDMSESFFLPTHAFESHEIRFTPREGQEALRVLVTRANSKVAIYTQSDRQLVAQSRPVESG